MIAGGENMNYKSLIILLLGLGLVQVGFAANITNNIAGVGPTNNLINPYICIQDANGGIHPVAPGATVDGNSLSGNKYYIGAAIRFGGCDTSNTYLGYVGFNTSPYKVGSYSPPAGVHITYANPAIDSSGHITGKIQYTAINPNFNFLSKAPAKNSSWSFVGVNLSGMEFGKAIDPVVIPNLSEEDANSISSDLAEMRAFVSAGMNTVRVPVSWGYLQLEGAGKGELNLEYFNSYIKPLLETLTSAHVNTIVDLHAYMRYSVFGKEYSGCGMDGKCPDGTLVLDEKAYQDVWKKIVTLMKNDPSINMDYIMLDLVNEPVDVPDDLVFTIQASVIKSLREQGYQGAILVEGNSWSGLHSWTTNSWNSRDGKTTYTNASLFTRDNFIKAGVTDLSKIYINAHQYLDSDYSGTHNNCMTDLDTQGASGFNLQAFADYLKQNHLKAIVTEFGAGTDSASCKIAMAKFLDYMKVNSDQGKDYGFSGWTIWSVGHGWGSYNLRVTPVSYQMQVLKEYLNF